jgi:tetratricopeptide (TPR) repeat protein
MERAAALSTQALAFGLLAGILAVGATAAAAVQDFADGYSTATDLYEQGAYGEAYETLKAAMEFPKSPDEAEDARDLLEEVVEELEEQFEREVAAREEAAEEADEIEAARREFAADLEQRLARADQLSRRAAEEDDPELRVEAIETRLEADADRVAYVARRAMDFYEQGEYEQAKDVLQRVAKFISDQQEKEPEVRVPVPDTLREQVGETLAKIDEAQKNQSVYNRILAERAKAEEQRQNQAQARAQALRLYEQGMAYYDDGQWDAAAEALRESMAINADIGPEAAQRRADALAESVEEIQSIQQARATALAQLNRGEKMLDQGKLDLAASYLKDATRRQDDLSGKDQQRLAALLRELEAAYKQETVRLAEEEEQAQETTQAQAEAQAYLQEQLRKLKVQQERARELARQQVLLAEAAYKQVRYEEALEHVNEALKHDPQNQRAQDLRQEIEAILEPREFPDRIWTEKTFEQRSAGIERARSLLREAINKGKLKLDSEAYDEAIEQFTEAQSLIAYLRPYGGIEGVEAEVEQLLANAREARQRREELIRMESRQKANQLAIEAALAVTQRERADTLALLKEAHAEFSRGKYQSCIDMCEKILERDPDSDAARELLEEATEKVRARTWKAVRELKEKNWQAERLRLKDRLTWPGGHFEYPAKPVWDQIGRRIGVELPTASAVKTPKELVLATVLDQELPAFQFEERPLDDVINFFKEILENRVDFYIDPDIMDQDVLVTLSLSNVTLRNALRAMLRNKGLNFVISSNGYIYISTEQGCLIEEAQEWNLSLRQYNIRDLLVDLDTSTGDDDDDDDDTGDDDDDDDGVGGGGDAQDIIDLIYDLTGGARTWDSVGGVGEGEGDEGGLGGFGGGAAGPGFGPQEPPLGGEEFGAFPGAEPGAGAAGLVEGNRVMIYRSGWLMVKHVDRIHKEIEKILAQLRAQTTVLVSVEARQIIVTDNFWRDFSINLFELNRDNPTQGLGNWSHTNTTTSTHVSDDSGLFDLPSAEWFFNLIPASHTTAPGGLSSSVLSITGSFLGEKDRRILISTVKDSLFSSQVSAPHIIAANTQERDVEFEQIGYFISSYEVQDGIAIPQLESYTISATDMTVRPVVSADHRYVTMSIDPEITTGTVTSIPIVVPIRGGNGEAGTSVVASIDVVEESTSNLESTIKVPDRGTVVLGGLASAVEETGEGTVPVLGNIPLIKRLFIRSSDAYSRSHTIFLVTPTIIIQEEIEP